MLWMKSHFASAMEVQPCGSMDSSFRRGPTSAFIRSCPKELHSEATRLNSTSHCAFEDIPKIKSAADDSYAKECRPEL